MEDSLRKQTSPPQATLAHALLSDGETEQTEKQGGISNLLAWLGFDASAVM
jgi:hypothetical protein